VWVWRGVGGIDAATWLAVAVPMPEGVGPGRGPMGAVGREREGWEGRWPTEGGHEAMDRGAGRPIDAGP
jgi:hypothetical protein